MNNPLKWWTEIGDRFLSESLAFINSSAKHTDPIQRCDALCKALNKTWTEHYRYREQHKQLTKTEQENRRSDSQAITQLLLTGLTTNQLAQFCNRKSVRDLVTFSPQIMNHDILIRNRYDPCNIDDAVRRKASEDHRKLTNAYQRFEDSPGDTSNRDSLLKKLATVVYIVRCNIAHSEKTPNGPDVEKTERDRVISVIVSAVLEDFFSLLFDDPDSRLAVYGTLNPGEANAAVVDDIKGEWQDAEVDGRITTEHGFQKFTWILDSEKIPVKVLTASTMSQNFKRLDKFEGPNYRRIWVFVHTSTGLQVCNIYAASS